ncbi:hypothetical protein H8K90_01995 [Winogradskyella echinorum]|uniref:Uncharacterized protein n=1 Tax=Winogradskyella echinorum TaxID=538189 RepID=A0ABR6XXA7_9FLAO|nr:hypothetical protein [Winogradskyella echinorum]MBC3845139.1 hypothetical protein [Winogradskyella echinorum]MBC5749487.1 hypothetical protein [Winogradskyella echinorum]
MELLLNQELEFVPEPAKVSHFTNNGLLNSNYKSVVKHNYSKSTTKSVFGIRQRLKSSQFKMVDHTAAILKLSVFAIALIAIF